MLSYVIHAETTTYLDRPVKFIYKAELLTQEEVQEKQTDDRSAYFKPLSWDKAHGLTHVEVTNDWTGETKSVSVETLETHFAEHNPGEMYLQYTFSVEVNRGDDPTLTLEEVRAEQDQRGLLRERYTDMPSHWKLSDE